MLAGSQTTKQPTSVNQFMTTVFDYMEALYNTILLLYLAHIYLSDGSRMKHVNTCVQSM